MKLLLLGIFIFSNVSTILGSNILAFMPSPYGSHLRTYKPLFKELARKGHNVTFYTGIPFEEEIPNMKQIVTRVDFQGFFEQNVKKGLDKMNGWQHILFQFNTGLFVCQTLFRNPDIQALIQSSESFDVILSETLFTHEPFVALGYKFNAPIVHLHPFRDEVWLSELTRNPQPLSYVPNYRLPTTDRMTFLERCSNVALSIAQIAIGHWWYLPEQEKLMREYFKYPGSEKLPPLTDQLRNSSLVFLDGNQIITSVSPLLPNLIQIGGIQIPPTRKLPADLEAWINDSPNGVIYLSLGSMMKISNLDPAKLAVFLNVLGKLRQRVLWKWEKDGNIPGQPSNVRTSKWFPQLDILAHPKCRAFITHGGFHSMYEAAYFGVPIVGTPIFADQESNIIMAEKNGVGQLVRFSEFTEDALYSAINTVLNDPSFKKNGKRLSSLLRDVPITPMETAIYWVEHVIRNKGVPHLTPYGVYLPWYQYYMVDVVGALLAIIVFIILVLRKISKSICRRFFRKSLPSKNKKELNKFKRE